MENKQEFWSEEQINEYLENIKKTKGLNADLHNHTTGSDGTQSPLMMLLRASNRGKNIVSMSDHDSVKGYTQLKIQILEKFKELEKLSQKKDIKDEEKEKVKVATKRLLKILENIKILPAAELITSYKGYSIEILGYGVNPEILDEEIKSIHKGLIPGSKLLLEGVDRIIEENNLVFDKYVIDNRNDFKKLFFHEMKKHPENKMFYEKFDGENEEEMAEAFSKEYLEKEDSPFYVDMSTSEFRGVKQIRADFLKMLENNKNILKFDEHVIAYSHAVTGEFFNEVTKHPENMHLLGKDVDTLKKFIYGELYNPESPFFIDMSPSRPSREVTIEAIHKAGGKAFLAHPGRYKKQFDVEKEIEVGSILEDVDGIEVFYPTHDEKMRQYLLSKCRERDLHASGGSDDHLAPKDGVEYKMGTVEIPEIPETEWIKETIKNGGDYINEAIELKGLIDRLRALRKEKSEKQEELQRSEERDKGDSLDDR